MTCRSTLAIAAALFLAMGTAHAETSGDPDNSLMFSCEKIVDRYSPKEDLGNAVEVEHQHISDMELYTINVTAFHHRKKVPLTIVFDAVKEQLTVNGKRCARGKLR